MSELKAERTHVDRYTVKFQVLSPKELTKSEIEVLQAKAGYHPAGYGDPKRILNKSEGNNIIYTWECSGSCD